jgi:hypothetical protein
VKIRQAAAVLLFLTAGALVESWSGDWDSRPGTIHSCSADRENNTRITGHQDGVVQKYSHDGSFGRPGHQLGTFTHGHALAVDSQGNLYVAETDTGRRIQKFTPRR